MARNKPSDVISNQNLAAMQNQEERIPEGGASGQPTNPIYQSGSGHEIIPEEDPTPVPPPIKYRVAVGGMITIDGMKTILRPGKVIKETDYDIEKLRNQGIQLSEI